MTQAGTNWHYAVGSERIGPIDITALRQKLASGELHANTLVWTDGLPNWIAAVTHPDLAVAAQQQLPMPGTPQPGAYSPGVQNYVAPGGTLQYYASPTHVVYAGSWLRFAGSLLDRLIVGVAGCIVGGAFGFFYAITTGPGAGGNDPILQLVSQALGITISWLYYALMESSASQATLGKMACGIKVTDLDGNRITFGHATGRYFATIVSYLTLTIGFMMAGWTERKQTLHDMLAKTLVVRK
ncbi:hypothetical protein BH09PLA1_BH09PLA1_37410 [soil metagenome]